MAMNEEIVYDYNMDSVYQPSLLPEDIQRSVATYQTRENHCEFASFAYTYSRGNWQEDFKHRMSEFNFNPYVINLKQDNTPCVLYHLRSSSQTKTNLDPRPNNSFDIRIHNEKQNPNVEVGDDISFDRRVNSFTYSNNYPVLGSFAQELKNIINQNDDYEWEDILVIKFNKLRPYLHGYIEGLEDEEDINRAIKDFDDDDDDFTDFARYYKETYDRKLSDDLRKTSFVKFVNENISNIINNNKRACLFIITARNGIVIKPFSMFPEQDEILCTKDVKYRVTSVRDGLVHFSKNDTNSSSFEAFMHMPFICGDARQVERVLFINQGVIAASDKYRAIVDVIEMEEI